MLCDANGIPLRFLLSGGQASDISYAQPLLDEVSIPSSQRGHPRKRCKWLLADKGYDPVYGAMPLKRVIQKELVDPMAKKLLAGEIEDGSVVAVSAGADGLEIGKARVH